MRFDSLTFLFLMGFTTRSQTTLDWSDFLKGISLELSSPEVIFPGFQKASFSSKMKALEGKRIIIIGYLLLLDGRPETVLDLQFSQKPSYAMDELLFLNENYPNSCYYRIEKAEALSIK